MFPQGITGLLEDAAAPAFDPPSCAASSFMQIDIAVVLRHVRGL